MGVGIFVFENLVKLLLHFVRKRINLDNWKIIYLTPFGRRLHPCPAKVKCFLTYSAEPKTVWCTAEFM
jgi:hypothetical protein